MTKGTPQAKAKRAGSTADRAILTGEEVKVMMRLVDSERLYVVPLTKAQKPRKVASASLRAEFRLCIMSPEFKGREKTVDVAMHGFLHSAKDRPRRKKVRSSLSW